MAPAEPENDAAGGSRSLTWRLRRIALMAFDSCCWVFALFAATVLRYELDLHQVEPRNVALIAVCAVVGVLVIGTALQVHQGRHCIGTVGDAISVSAATALLGAGLFVANLLTATPLVPRTVPVIATLIALVLAVGVRLSVRLCRERSSRPDRHTSQRVIIFGAGTEGQQLVRSMLSDPGSAYLPVALLDDRPDLRSRRVSGVGVRGTHADLAAVAAATRADLLVMAQREVGTEIVRTLARTATEAGLGVKVLPPRGHRHRGDRRVPGRPARARHRRGRFHRLGSAGALAPSIPWSQPPGNSSRSGRRQSASRSRHAREFRSAPPTRRVAQRRATSAASLRRRSRMWHRSRHRNHGGEVQGRPRGRLRRRWPPSTPHPAAR
jgi:hypothetical protein